MTVKVKHPTISGTIREFATKKEADRWIAVGWVEVKTRKSNKSQTIGDESAAKTNKD